MRTGSLVTLTLTLIIGMAVAAGPTERTLYTFTGGLDGTQPSGNLVLDASGNLYGTTTYAGTAGCLNGFGCGTIFELTRDRDIWTEHTIYNFAGSGDGSNPMSGLLLDDKGNLYGTTTYGGSGTCLYYSQNYGCGTVFELSPSNGGWKESILYDFQGGSDGLEPTANLIFDKTGNLYGTASYGGIGGCQGLGGEIGCGVVFQLSPSNGGWRETVLHRFNSLDADGQIPYAPLQFDSSENLYGTTFFGGNSGYGTVFAVNHSNGNWSENVLYSFCAQGGYCSDGRGPYGGVAFDAAGRLYGTTLYGDGTKYNDPIGRGVVFELARSQIGWTESVIHNFQGGKSDGGFPNAGVTIDRDGDLFGTTIGGAEHKGGEVFRLRHSASGWKEIQRYSLLPSDSGSEPLGAVVFDSGGNLFTTASEAGMLHNGTVFEIVP